MEVRNVNSTAEVNIVRGVHIKGMTSKGESQRDKEVKSLDVPVRERKYTEEELIRSIESANEQFIVFDRRFEFSIHEKTKHIMVKVIDIATDEVIREIPPEKILDLVAGIWELSGILVDERV